MDIPQANNVFVVPRSDLGGGGRQQGSAAQRAASWVPHHNATHTTSTPTPETRHCVSIDNVYHGDVELHLMLCRVVDNTLGVYPRRRHGGGHHSRRIPWRRTVSRFLGSHALSICFGCAALLPGIPPLACCVALGWRVPSRCSWLGRGTLACELGTSVAKFILPWNWSILLRGSAHHACCTAMLSARRVVGLRHVVPRIMSPHRVAVPTTVKRCVRPALRWTSSGSVSAAAPKLSPPAAISVWARTLPPLPVRASLVGATVGLATPLFPVIGFLRAVYHFVPYAPLRLVLTGGTIALVSFAFREVLPAAFTHAPLFASCALVNALVSGAAYLALDVAVGGPHALMAVGRTLLGRSFRFGLPVVGAGIGVFTALVSPYLYPQVMLRHFGVELDPADLDSFWRVYPRFLELMMPVTLFTGAVAGGILQPLLTPLLTGSLGQPWPRAAGLAVVVTMALAAYTFASADPIGDSLEAAGLGARDSWLSLRGDSHASPHSTTHDPAVPFQHQAIFVDQLLKPGEVEALPSVRRLHWRTGRVCSTVQAATHTTDVLPSYIPDGGQRALQGEHLRDAVRQFQDRYPYPVFRSSGQAQLARLRGRFPILSFVLSEPKRGTVSPTELTPRRLAHTDAVARVAYLTHTSRGKGAAGSGHAASGSASESTAVRQAASRVVSEVASLRDALRQRPHEDDAPDHNYLTSAARLHKMVVRSLEAVALLRTLPSKADERDGLEQLPLQARAEALVTREELERAGWKILGGTVDVRALDSSLRDMGAVIDLQRDYVHVTEERQEAESRKQTLMFAAAAGAVAIAAGVVAALR